MNSIGLRERKKIATRRAIAAVALELAHRHGPDQVTVDDIAEAADVSPRTVFNYFGTKDEAILGTSPESRAETIEMVRIRPVDEPPLQSLKNVLFERLTTVDETGRYWRSRAELVRRFPELQPAYVASQVALETQLVSVIAERMDLDPDVDMYPGLVVAVAFAALRVALSRPAVGPAGDVPFATGPQRYTGGTSGDIGSGTDEGVTLGRNLAAAFDSLESGLRQPEVAARSAAKAASVAATPSGRGDSAVDR